MYSKTNMITIYDALEQLKACKHLTLQTWSDGRCGTKYTKAAKSKFLELYHKDIRDCDSEATNSASVTYLQFWVDFHDQFPIEHHFSRLNAAVVSIADLDFHCFRERDEADEHYFDASARIVHHTQQMLQTREFITRDEFEHLVQYKWKFDEIDLPTSRCMKTCFDDD